jgi:hypothetical protein
MSGVVYGNRHLTPKEVNRLLQIDEDMNKFPKTNTVRKNLGVVLEELEEEEYLAKASRSGHTVQWNGELSFDTKQKLDDLIIKCKAAIAKFY